jgi:hypothetical protein
MPLEYGVKRRYAAVQRHPFDDRLSVLFVWPFRDLGIRSGQMQTG